MGTKGPITRSKGGVLLYGHLILLKVMKSLHQCKQKSATILNISPLQIVPHLLSGLMVLKTRYQKRLHTGNNGTHHTATSLAQAVTAAAPEPSLDLSAGGAFVKWDARPWPLNIVLTENAHS
ncbi:unnamed protein product [Miscanthus lutarioriparius]|uniref:Uncharacterized protein n=1 Tax=Miscanthus lutarioriparius TaxID=422564 RepID=A0A811S370_9POAL|nr:unnamed protein product [Miscanthus lutarioriparius]